MSQQHPDQPARPDPHPDDRPDGQLREQADELTYRSHYQDRVLDLTPVARPHASGLFRRVIAQGGYETRTTLSNGEQLLVSIILPLMVLIALSVTDFIVAEGATVSPVNLATPGVLALAVLSSGLTGQGIATGFDRRYGVLRYLSTTPLGPTGLLLGKAVAVVLVLIVQLMVLGLAALFLEWRPVAVGVLYAGIFIVLGAVTFTALGLLIAGTVRPEATLAITNLLWVILGAAGGVVFAVPENLFGELLQFLPSAALGEGLRSATVRGQFDLLSFVILVVWAAIFTGCTVRWFKWR
ncbi:ABC transporter permease [Auritidibacter ignavus]|uniref:ABC transporter permease n=1 Tax=Auritidibacter ignavus TaxID=678932 RepID=A0AAJ6APF0_9MICC|nr:ABC transporter permease [Auritidibacter ignavus]WGH93670.1 ABC transporter permease [Auritidibacter ignavus]